MLRTNSKEIKKKVTGKTFKKEEKKLFNETAKWSYERCDLITLRSVIISSIGYNYNWDWKESEGKKISLLPTISMSLHGHLQMDGEWI